MNIIEDFDLFVFKPNVGIGPFLFGEPIDMCWTGSLLDIQEEIDDDFWKKYPDIPFLRRFHLIRKNKELIIYTDSSGLIESFNTELLFYNNHSLVGKNINDNKTALAISDWDKEEMIEVGDSLQKIYYYYDFGLMFWTIDDIVLNVSVYKQEKIVDGIVQDP